MKSNNTTCFILYTLTLSAMLLSACSGVSVPVTGDNSNVNGSPSTPGIVDNGNNANSNVNSNDANSNDNTNSNSNTNTNDSGIEIVGVVEVITEDTVQINGVTYPLANLTEFTDLLSVGDQVKVHLIVNEDGTFTILQLEIITTDNSNNANSNDDNSNGTNSNDDNGNDSNSNDDNGGNDNNSGNGNGDDDGGNNNNDNGGSNNG